MNQQDCRYAIFETVPLERLAIGNRDDALALIAGALEKSGFEPTSGRREPSVQFFQPRDRERIVQLAREGLLLPGDDAELVSLATECFEQLVVIATGTDLLFALAGANDPSRTYGATSRPAWYIATEMGGIIFPPSIARILCATALRNAGCAALAQATDCTSSMPQESALSGDITFIAERPGIEIAPLELSGEVKIRPLSVLSSKLLTGDIVDLLLKESGLDRAEIARALPLQFAGLDNAGRTCSIVNHFQIKALSGTLLEVLEQFVDISLHLNWSSSRNFGEKLTDDAAFPYAVAQTRRLKQLEEKENAIRAALHLLQKRYPKRQDPILWEIDNLYSNVLRYSPLYLRFKKQLEEFIEGNNSLTAWLPAIFRQIDWTELESRGIARTGDSRHIPELLVLDPGSTLAKLRVIVEKMIAHLFGLWFPGETGTLATMLSRLNERNAFPPIIYVCLNSLRLAGNIGAHQTVRCREDVEALVPMFVRVVEWFLDEGLPRTTR
jgi:hypothetical protein